MHLGHLLDFASAQLAEPVKSIILSQFRETKKKHNITADSSRLLTLPPSSQLTSNLHTNTGASCASINLRDFPDFPRTMNSGKAQIGERAWSIHYYLYMQKRMTHLYSNRYTENIELCRDALVVRHPAWMLGKAHQHRCSWGGNMKQKRVNWQLMTLILCMILWIIVLSFVTANFDNCSISWFFDFSTIPTVLTNRKSVVINNQVT